MSEAVVMRFVPFEHGFATIVPVTAPRGRYNCSAQRYSIERPVCYVSLFRDGAKAETASFFGSKLVMGWIESELGPMSEVGQGEQDEQSCSEARRAAAYKVQLVKYGLLAS